LLPPHIQDPAPSTYLYLAQTAPTPQEALQLYESAIKLLEGKTSAQDKMQEQVEEVTKEELMKECITAIVAMIEIWMSDLWYVLVVCRFEQAEIDVRPSALNPRHRLNVIP